MDGRWDRETLDDALDVLGDLPEWRLPAPRWEQVDAILGRMRLAFEAGNAEELRAATADLELHGPVRANRIGTKEPEGPDLSLLERQNHLQHALRTAVPRSPGGGTEDEDGARADRPAR